MLSYAEENYLKTIYKLTESSGSAINTNSIAQNLDTSAASVTDMLKKLADKHLLHYEKYRGASLTPEGNRLATQLIRRHRLWEVFLAEKLQFKWDEVHELAEELEHIQSVELIDRLDNYLGNPRFDPHGDPIPNQDGKFTFQARLPLSELEVGDWGKVTGVRDHNNEFLTFLDSQGIFIGLNVQVIEKYDYDKSTKIRKELGRALVLTYEVLNKILVKKGEPTVEN